MIKKSIIEALSVRSKDGTGDLWALEGQHSLSRTSRPSFSRKIKLISGRQHLICTCSSIMAVVETGRFLCKYNIWHRVPHTGFSCKAMSFIQCESVVDRCSKLPVSHITFRHCHFIDEKKKKERNRCLSVPDTPHTHSHTPASCSRLSVMVLFPVTCLSSPYSQHGFIVNACRVSKSTEGRPVFIGSLNFLSLLFSPLTFLQVEILFWTFSGMELLNV